MEIRAAEWVARASEPKGRFEGFRYTDFGEFRTLYGLFLACTNVSGFCNNYERMLFFIDAVGGNREGFAAIYKLGMPDTDPREPRVYMNTAFFELFSELIPRYQFDLQQLSVPYTYRSASGHFIVRAARAGHSRADWHRIA